MVTPGAWRWTLKLGYWCLPSSVASAHIHYLSWEETIFDEAVDVLTELRQPAVAAQSSQVEHWHHQGLREALQALLRSLLALHGLQVGEAGSARQSTAPHQTVAKDGPLKKLTVGGRDRKTENSHLHTNFMQHVAIFAYK